MKKYDEIIKKEVFVCNCCGELIAAVDESDRRLFWMCSKAWGYFSKWMAVSTIFIYVKNAMKK